MIEHSQVYWLKGREQGQKKKKKGNQLRIRVFALSCTHPTWKNYHRKTVGSLIKQDVIYSSFHD